MSNWFYFFLLHNLQFFFNGSVTFIMSLNILILIYCTLFRILRNAFLFWFCWFNWQSWHWVSSCMLELCYARLCFCFFPLSASLMVLWLLPLELQDLKLNSGIWFYLIDLVINAHQDAGDIAPYPGVTRWYRFWFLV